MSRFLHEEINRVYTIVAPKRDLRYVSRIVSYFYKGWVEVREEPSREGYSIELRCGYGESSLVNPRHVVEYVGARRLSSIPPRELVKVIEKARARLRLTATYSGCHILDDRGEKLFGLEPHPGYDMLFFLGSEVECLLRDLGMKNPPEIPLVIRRFRGVHDIYSGTQIIGRLFIPDEGTGISFEALGGMKLGNRIECLLEKNDHVIREHVRVSRRVLEATGSPDIVVVSFSGGKDSIVALDLAIKHYGKNKVVPIYVDTGLEFPQTIDYVEDVEEYYGVEVVRAYAGVREAIKDKGLPTKNNRWCTRLKTKAFEEKLREVTRGYDKVLVVVGDRDAESASRSHRPPVRIIDSRVVEVAPIKQWSTAHVQLYIYLNKLPLNPLYKLGFYRIGCYICPALRSLELYIMTKKLWDKLYDKEYVKEFLREKNWVR